MDSLRLRCVPRDRWPTPAREFEALWADWKAANSYMDFTDLLENCFNDVEVMPGEPAAMCVDEAQDCSTLQFNLALKWGEHMQKLVFVGDHDQLLFQFASADGERFMSIIEGVPAERRKVLEKSYRVPRAVHALARRWIKQCDHRYEAEYNPRDFEGSVTNCYGATYRFPHRAIDLAEKVAAEGKTVMLLGTCAFHLEPLKAELKQRCIPFCNPYRLERSDWNPLLSGGKKLLPTDRVLAMLSGNPDTWGELARDWTNDDFYRWASWLKSEGVFKRGAKKWVDSCKGGSETLDASRMIDMLEPEHVATFYESDFSTAAGCKAALAWLVKHTLAAHVRKLEYPATIAATHGGKKLREQPKVMVGTIHSVKGGESDTVILFPDLSLAGMKEWCGMGRDAIRRLFYVGMTRAKENLVLCDPASTMHVAVA